MNMENWKQIDNLLPKTYFKQAVDAMKSRESLISQLIQHKKIPIEGWNDHTIEMFINHLSAMDSNNFTSNCGVGEREARFASEIVARRHFRFGHGIGRSGDLLEDQPKAVGSSLLVKLTNSMVKDLFYFMGIKEQIHCFIVPVATGMSLVLSMLSLKTNRPNAKYVIFSRIDQKACFKSILTAGLTPIIIDTICDQDELITNVREMERQISELEAKNILCIMSTTSCFAPRACDSIEIIAKLCKQHEIPHLINNAYGLQSRYLMQRIQKAHTAGVVDIFVQSTDKNLLVPVGGTIIAGSNKKLIEDIAKTYPGRASITPTLDAFITLLNLGKNGYDSLVQKRDEMYKYLHEKLTQVARKYSENLLTTPHNPISIGMTLNNVKTDQLTQVGSMLFLRNVSGSRIITTTEIKSISGFQFIGWGSHTRNYSTPYLTCASTLGVTRNDVDRFIKCLEKVFTKLNKKCDNII